MQGATTKELLDPPKQVLIGPQALEGELVLPPRAQAIIVFAHGSGSGRRSPRNLQVAHALTGVAEAGAALTPSAGQNHRRRISGAVASPSGSGSASNGTGISGGATSDHTTRVRPGAWCRPPCLNAVRR